MFVAKPSPKQLQKLNPTSALTEADRALSLDRFLQNVQREGGKGFLERVRRYGRTEKGDPITINRWFAEALECIGDLRIPIVLVSGAAQVGKTLSCTLLAIDTLAESEQNVGWFYSDLSSLRRNQPEQFEPAAAAWLDHRQSRTGIPSSTPGDRRNCERFSYQGGTVIFAYASTSRPSASRKGLAAIGSAGASFSCSLLFLEERSQWQPSSADGVTRRLDAGRFPSRPVRELGTFGSGSGIETEFGKANHHFYPHVICPHCRLEQPLDPKGCLLRPTQRLNAFGESEACFFSESGKPENWFHTNPIDPVGSAYIGCRHCEKPLEPTVRADAHFRCLKTGILLREFLDQVVPSLDSRIRVGVHFSPLVRKDSNLAERMIAEGLDSVSGSDWQQQALGWWSSDQRNSISAEAVKRTIGLPLPTTSVVPYTRLMGVDQGRSEDWAIAIDYYLDGGSTVQERFNRAIRQVRWGGGIVRSYLPDKLKELNIEHCLMDSEPDIESSFELSRQTVIQIADQQPNLLDDYKKGIAQDGGSEYEVWKLRSGKYQRQVMLGFYQSASDKLPLYRLPADWRRWTHMNTERSPIRHLTAVSFDPDSGTWERPKDKVDGVFYAAMFCEACFMLKLSGAFDSTLNPLAEAFSRIKRLD